MTTPFYVSPEQLMKDRADYVRKNIARVGSLAVLNYTGGILFVAENRSRVLHKISEIYDRIGFGAAGKWDEFEKLRQAGVRLADTRGYLYDRRDVTALGLANAYAQTLGTIFSEAGGKPYEVELVIAEVGDRPDGDQIYRLTSDGSVIDARGYLVVGGSADAVSAVLESDYREGLSLPEALRIAVNALGRTGGEPRTLDPALIEAAVLDRDRKRDRKFRRLVGTQLARLLADEPGAEAALLENGNGGSNGSGDGPAVGGGSAADSDAVAEPEAERADEAGSGPEAAPGSTTAAGGSEVLDEIDDLLDEGDDDGA